MSPEPKTQKKGKILSEKASNGRPEETAVEGQGVLTNRQGHPVYDNQNQRTVGARGPATLENYQFLEKISHFDRERIPERVVLHFYLIDDDYGDRVGGGLGIKAQDVAHLQPLPRQSLTEEDQARLSSLGDNPPRELSGNQMTGVVHVMQANEESTDGSAYSASGMQPSSSNQ